MLIEFLLLIVKAHFNVVLEGLSGSEVDQLVAVGSLMHVEGLVHPGVVHALAHAVRILMLLLLLHHEAHEQVLPLLLRTSAERVSECPAPSIPRIAEA